MEDVEETVVASAWFRGMLGFVFSLSLKYLLSKILIRDTSNFKKAFFLIAFSVY